jgi:RNA polymerase sigma factor for flagellar operon FliA
MYDPQFFPPLLASAAVDGVVASRPASRLIPEAHAGGVVEPLVKKQTGAGGELGRDSDAPPDGAPPDDSGGGGGGGGETGDAGYATSETAVPVVAGAEAAPEAAPAAAPEAAPAVGSTSQGDDAPDLSGYSAYGNTPAPGPSMSRDQLVTRYSHLVKYVVGRLGVSIPGLFDHEDAMQAGVLGLLRAIDAYKPEAAASFESYAILRIRGSILDAVRSLDTVGRAGREAARAIQGAIRDLQHELGRSPTESEIAARLNMPLARYRERLQAASVVTISLDEHDARDGDDESNNLADSAPDPNAVDPAEEASRRDSIVSLVQEIGRLSQRSRMVLALYYQDEMTFKEIGQVLGVTESRVCQIHTEAILALRGRMVDADVAARLGKRRGRS